MSRPSPFAFGLLTLATASVALHAQTRPATPPTPPARPAAAAATTPPKAPMAPPMASVDPKLFDGLRYRMIGPMVGGRVTTVTGVPSQPTTFYMGAASGGLFKTTNNGQSWIPITDGKVPVASTGSVAVSLSNPDVIYLGTGSDGVRSNVSTGRGIYRTTDGGKTWNFLGLYNAGQIGAVRIHPTDPNTAWLSATGDAFGKNVERGIFKTTDGGKTWKKTLYINDSTGGNDVVIQPGNPNVLYAAMGRLERRPWTIISGSSEGGLFKSTDAGETWTKMAGGLPNGLFGKARIAVTAANPQRIYALIEAAPGGGLYRSDDAGATWQDMHSPEGMIARPFYYTSLGADPTNQDVIYGGAENFYRSSNGGKTMQVMQTPHTDNHDIWISPKDGNIMIQANDGGANVSLDGGHTWSTQNNQPTAEIYGVWMDNQYPYNIYGAQQDNATWIVSSLPNGGNEFRTGGAVPGCETGPIMPYLKNPNIVYGSCKGIYEYGDLSTGKKHVYPIGGESLYGMVPKDMEYRFQRVSPMETSPHDPEVLYYGSQYVHRTRDKGVTWEKISPDLTAFDPCCQFPSGGPITRDNTGEEFYSTLYSIRESPVTAGVIWTGANDGPFYVTRDDGKSWTNVTPPAKDLPKGGRVSYIEPSPFHAGSAYYAVYRYLLGDFAPYIYKTSDYGVTWKRLTDGKNGIPADWPTRVVREDPEREGLLYAGTEFGMFISFDDGGHWQTFDKNLPQMPINDIKVFRQDLVVATQGRAIWIMDNVSPLEQITPTTLGSLATLYRPRDAFRIRPAGGGGRGGGGGGGGGGAAPAGGRGGRGGGGAASPVATDGPQPEYPPPGAMIDYYLTAAPSAPVVMEIREASGAVIRTLSSDAAGLPADSAAGRGAPARGGGAGAGGGGRGGRGGGGGAAPAIRLTTTVGLNRIYWDMLRSDGQLTPPGNYTVKLTIGTWSSTQPMLLRIDPRLAAEGLTAADLREQFDFNARASQLTTDANQVANRVRAARTRLANATGAAADTAAKVNKIALTLFGPDEGVRYGVPGMLTQITAVRTMTSTNTDEKVGREAIKRYGEMKKALDAIKADVDKVLGPG